MDDESPPLRYLELIDAHGVLDRLAEVNLKAKGSAFISFVFSDDKPLIKREKTLCRVQRA